MADVVREVFEEYQFTWDPEGYHADLYDLAGHFSPPEGFLAVGGVDPDNIVACCGISRHPCIPGEVLNQPAGEMARICGTSAELHRLYVRPAARRAGLGHQLTLACLDWAQGQGVQAVEIWSDKKFDAAHRLYENLGAERVGDRISNDPDDSPEWGYRLVLPLPTHLDPNKNRL